MFGRLESSLDTVNEIGRVLVDVRDETGVPGPILVILTDVDSLERINMDTLYGSGRVELPCPPGRYLLSAFVDANEDFTFDRGEPGRMLGDPSALVVDPGGAPRVTLHLRARDVDVEPGARAMLRLVERENPELRVKSAGKRASLDDEIFDKDVAEDGAWDPAGFLYRGLAGIYLLGDHRPDRIPVVFVHGIFGSPRDLRPLIETLDRERFEPWVYYYPSSMRLADVGHHLEKELHLLTLEHKPARVVLVGHSMGGLVACQAAAEYARGDRRPYLVKLVTLASPLGGMRSAQLGARFAPTPMPCWYDLAPSSPFLAELFTQPLPAHLEHHLFLAFGSGNGDGTVGTISQLPAGALDRARLHAVETDHMGILSDARTHREFDAILRAVEALD